jgi:dihydropyrimidine dehydrogenase (NADP+)
VRSWHLQTGYHLQAVKPIALAKCMQLSTMMRNDFNDRSLSGIGGVERGSDAAEFILVGANTVQARTGHVVIAQPFVPFDCPIVACSVRHPALALDVHDP